MKYPADERQQQQHERKKGEDRVRGYRESKGVNLGPQQIFRSRCQQSEPAIRRRLWRRWSGSGRRGQLKRLNQGDCSNIIIELQLILCVEEWVATSHRNV